ncbi:MAG: 6-phosphogluconolactonase [Turicibacter sp.]
MIKIFETEEALAEVIASEMKKQLETLENPLFCLASGSTPAKSYKRFVKLIHDSQLIKKAKFVSLDEWVGIPKSVTGSCYQMLEADLFKHLRLEDDQIVFFETVDCDLALECQRIDAFIEKNPITYSLMGVGMNGHSGLNEPMCAVKNYSSVVPLSEKTKEVAQKYFEDDVVLVDGITLGLEQVIASKRVVVVMTGAHKKEIAKEVIENPGAHLPAQVLLGYQHIDFYFDKEAASLISQTRIEELNR